jgi:hypothetical protein
MRRSSFRTRSGTRSPVMSDVDAGCTILDELEDGHPGLDLASEPRALEQLALERRGEALAHRVVVAVCHRSHRGSHSGLLPAEPEGDRDGLQPWSERWITLSGLRCPTAMLRASRTRSVRRCVAMAQPTMRQRHASRTTARSKNPAHVEMYVISARPGQLQTRPKKHQGRRRDARGRSSLQTMGSRLNQPRSTHHGSCARTRKYRHTQAFHTRSSWPQRTTARSPRVWAPEPCPPTVE